MGKAVDGEVTWIHSDHLHSATILTDDDGHEIRRLAYRAFGEELENQGSGAEPTYSYTGKERDRSGLMYYGARYYDPALSRFITADTLYDRGPQGLNRYAYALNNPIRYNEPTGHSVGADPNTGLIDPPTHKDEQYYYATQPRRAHTLQNLEAGMGDGAVGLGELANENPEAMRALNVALGGKAHAGYGDTTVQLLTDARTATGADGDMTTISSADVAMVMARDKERQSHWYGNENGVVTASEHDIDVGIFGIGVASGGMIRTSQPSGIHEDSAIESPQKPIAGKITGNTKHGLNQAIGRNGGRGVNGRAILDAIRSPKKIVSQANGSMKYVGKRATVILNQEGKIVTTYGKSRGPQIWTQGTTRASGSGSAQSKANESGFSYWPKAIR